MGVDGKHKASDAALRKMVASDWWEWKPGMRVRNLAIGGSSSLLVTHVHRRGDGKRSLRVGGTGHPEESFLPVVSSPATAGFLLDMFLSRRRGGDQDLALMELSAAVPGPEAYASFGDFLVAELLAGELP
jgi:hypothetical protein